MPFKISSEMSSEDSQTPGEIFALVATWQGHISYTLFSIYAVNPTVFYYYLGRDPGAFLFSNMLYGNAVHIYTRPAMRKLRPSFRICYSIYGSYCFNFSSLLIFFALGETMGEKPLLVSFLGYAIGKFMYTMFYSYLYFVDKLSDPMSRRGESGLNLIFARE